MTQNVPTKKPKLITKQRQKLKDINSRAGKEQRHGAKDGLSEQGAVDHLADSIIEES